MRVVPMIFNAEMVKALIAGDKVVTRRPAKNLSFSERVGFIVGELVCGIGFNIRETMNNCIKSKLAKCPAQTGDLIYVRETFAALGHIDYQEVSPMNCHDVHEFRYKASERDLIANCDDWEVRGYRWRPSIHMPRRASRITLKVTDVRIERVQDITEEQAILEGVPTREEAQNMAIECGLNWYQGPKAWFRGAWDRIYGNWSDNPYVWVIEFEVIKENVDKYIQSLN